MPGGVQTQKQTFIEHLQELRRRLLLPSALFFAVATLAFFQSDKLVGILQKPLNKTLYYNSPAGGFSLLFQIAIFCGLIVALPLVVRQLIKFVEPVMGNLTKSTINRYYFSSIMLALLGVACGYLISLPSALHFLNSFESENVQAIISADQYLSFVMVYLAGFAVVFQLPLLISITNRITPLKPSKLMKKFKFVFVGAFVVAAVLTPTPDVVNQAIFAAPILVLYLASVLMVAFTNRHQTYQKQSKAIRTVHSVEGFDPIPLSLDHKPATQPVVVSRVNTEPEKLAEAIKLGPAINGLR